MPQINALELEIDQDIYATYYIFEQKLLEQCIMGNLKFGNKIINNFVIIN